MRGRTSRELLFILLTMFAVASPTMAADPAMADGPGKDRRYVYRFVVRKSGLGRTWIRGAFVVDGTVRVVTRARTPFRFECEAAREVHGFFETVTPGRRLSFRVYAPEEDGPRAVADARGTGAIYFTWGVDPSLPRCIATDDLDRAEKTCSPEEPTYTELHRRLAEALRRTGGRGGGE